MINTIFKDIDHIKSYSFNNGENIIKTNNGQYIVKEKIGNKKELYSYLRNRNFTNFLDLKNDDVYEIYPYKEDNINKPDKAIDLVYILCMLHIKTTTYKEINLDRIKEVYESFNTELNDLYNYYYNIQDYIESKVYMAPAEYLLIRNISTIYEMLNISKKNIDKWYKIKEKQNKERVVLLHNNISINNFIDAEEKVLKNWDSSTKDWVVYDFYNFYRNDYKYLEFSSLFEIYQKKYKYTEEEYLLFKALVFKIWKVKLNSSNYDNCVKVNDLIIYIEKTKKLLSKNNQKEQETNKDKFK
ncbi:MAG: hypothetical protein IJF92_04150 [Bacilli bacterium]|nr:hypothetical protein [Bacilli bacterium]